MHAHPRNPAERTIDGGRTQVGLGSRDSDSFKKNRRSGKAFDVHGMLVRSGEKANELLRKILKLAT